MSQISNPEQAAERERKWADRIAQEEERARQRAAYDRIQLTESLWARSGVMPIHRKGIELRKTATGPWAECYQRIHSRMHNSDDPIILGMIGTRGNGKTQITACLIRDFCEEGKQAMYVRASALFRQIRDSFQNRNDGPSEIQIMESFIAPSLLVIDEAHERGGSDFENQRMTEITDMRYGHMRHTIFLSNENKAEFVAGLGPSIISRMGHYGGMIECTWPSFRKPGPAT